MTTPSTTASNSTDATGYGDIVTKIIKHLVQHPERGTTSQEAAQATGLSPRRAVACLYRMKRDGRLHSTGQHKHTRYFLTAQAATEAKASLDAEAQALAAAKAATKHPTLTRDIMAAVAAAGAFGTTPSELRATTGQTSHYLTTVLSRQTAKRKLWRGGPKRCARYFANATWAVAYTQRMALVQAKRDMRQAAPTTAEAPQTQPHSHTPAAPKAHASTRGAVALQTLPAMPAPVRIGKGAFGLQADAKVIIPPNVKITVAPTPKSRYTPDGGPIVGGFANSRPGVYEPGRSWSAAYVVGARA